jgi:O-antigen ligase
MSWRPGRLAAGSAVGVLVVCLIAGLAAVATERDGPGEADYGGLTHGRLDLWGDGVEAFAEDPVSGTGAKSFFEASVVSQEGSPIRFAHNLPIEVAVELGLLGLVAVLALYGTTFLAAWRARYLVAAWWFAPGALAFLIANLFDFPWHIPAVGAVWAVALGGLLGVLAQPGGASARSGGSG